MKLHLKRDLSFLIDLSGFCLFLATYISIMVGASFSSALSLLRKALRYKRSSRAFCNLELVSIIESKWKFLR